MKLGRAARQVEFNGVFAASVTPNRPGTLEVDFSGLLEVLDFLAAGGVSGICLMGSTGEFAHFGISDRQRAVYLGVKRSRVPLIVGVGHSTLSGALELASEAISSGADGLLLMPPFFFPYGQPEIERFYLEFAREAGGAIPTMLYNIPQFTSPIRFETARRLLETSLFAGIKDSSGDWPYFESLLELRRDRAFTLFAGNDRIAMRAVQSGADGFLSGCACAIPEVLVALYLAAKSGDAGRAEKLNGFLTEFIDWIERFPTPAGIKRAVAIRGQKSGDLAIPASPATEAALDEFSAWFRAWLPAALNAARG